MLEHYLILFELTAYLPWHLYQFERSLSFHASKRSSLNKLLDIKPNIDIGYDTLHNIYEMMSTNCCQPKSHTNRIDGKAKPKVVNTTTKQMYMFPHIPMVFLDISHSGMVWICLMDYAGY